MSNSGKVIERKRAREMRAQGAKLSEICESLGVSKSSASVWVRDVPFIPQKRANSSHRRPHAQAVAKQTEIAAGIQAGKKYFSNISDKEFFAAGIALYAGEGTKSYSSVELTNTDPRIIWFYVRWLRSFYQIAESRLRVSLYLHDDLSLTDAVNYWSEMLAIPQDQFNKPYIAISDSSRKKSVHIYGCIKVRYHCSHTARLILGHMDGLLEYSDFPR